MKRMKLQLALLICASLLSGFLPFTETTVGAQKSGPPLEPELYQALLDLTNPFTVMCVAAHPDDEDGATLTVLRRKFGVHTVTLFSTYGEGGQNATGPELYEELGVIRARETEEAAKIQGSEAHFLDLKDFGFSKSAEEAFKVWGHDEALRRMVLKIRELRPDVIITNHDTTGGHGHHQATGRLVLEAFDAAADPSRFPEQLKDGRVQVWQAQRLFVRAGYEGGATSKTLDAEAERAGRIVTVNRNERDPVRGTTYAEQALQALRKHASQGPWPQTLPPQGWPPVRYRLAREAKDAAPLPANPQTFLDNLSIPQEPVGKVVPLAVRAAFNLYESQQASLESVLAALVALRQSTVFTAPEGSRDKARFELMSRRLDRALAVATGVSVELLPDTDVLIPGTPVTARVRVSNQGRSVVEIKRESLRVNGREAESETFSNVIQKNHTLNAEPLLYRVPSDAVINVPQAEHLYDGHLFGEELTAEFLMKVDGAQFTLTASRRFNVAPPVEIESISPSPLVITPQTAGDAQTFTFRINNHTTTEFKGGIGSTKLMNISKAFWFTVPSRTVREIKMDYGLPGKGQMRLNGKEFFGTRKFAVLPEDYGSKPSQLISERDVKFIYADARVDPKLRVGYVRSTDFTLPNALAALGVQAKELTVDEIGAGNLSSYDAIIIDNRGYQAHTELIGLNQKLLDYANAGGTLIVFYHKTNEWNVDAKANRPTSLAPYEIVLGNARVTDENAPVEFTQPEHPLLNFPNKLTADDFKGWIQERGLYFPKEWDKRYAAPLAMSDAGEPKLQGGLLATEYGRGRYIYTSIVWYRQLREGVPGAYRMLANMISYGKEQGARADSNKIPRGDPLY